MIEIRLDSEFEGYRGQLEALYAGQQALNAPSVPGVSIIEMPRDIELPEPFAFEIAPLADEDGLTAQRLRYAEHGLSFGKWLPDYCQEIGGYLESLGQTAFRGSLLTLQPPAQYLRQKNIYCMDPFGKWRVEVNDATRLSVVQRV